jgi:electron transport complex protein RnfC
MKPLTLWGFSGGLHLDGRRVQSHPETLHRAPIPARLVFPLRRRDGRLAEPRVAPGDMVLRGEILAGGADVLDPPILASTSGRVLAIEPRPAPSPSGLDVPAIVLEADGEDAPRETAGLPDYLQQPPAELRRRVHAAGIVGLGGAAFPAAAKLDPGGRAVRTLIVNGVECEPYIACDETLLRHDAASVLAGADVLRHALGADACLLAIENDRPEALAAAENACRCGKFGQISIVAVPAIYPAGGERQLIRTLTGLEVPSGGLPADIGVVCLNAGTAAAAYRAIARGEPLTSRIITVTGGGVRRPGNLEVRLGTPIADLVEHCGGYTERAERLILGGPLMGYSLSSDAVPVTATTNCILVAAHGEVAPPAAPQPCIRCGACAEVCPAGLLPQQLHWYGRSEQLDRSLGLGLLACMECGCCDLVCPSHIPLAQSFRDDKALARSRQREREREREREKADHARARYEARQARKLAEKQEQAEAARRRKDTLSKSAAPEIKQAIERARQKRAASRTSAEPADALPEKE